MRRLGGHVLTLIAREELGHGDWRDSGPRLRSEGWSLQPMAPSEQEQMGLQVTRRWRAIGPALQVPGTFQVEADHLVDADGQRLRLDVHGELEVWPDRHGRPDHTEGVLELIEGSSR